MIIHTSSWPSHEEYIDYRTKLVPAGRCTSISITTKVGSTAHKSTASLHIYRQTEQMQLYPDSKINHVPGRTRFLALVAGPASQHFKVVVTITTSPTTNLISLAAFLLFSKKSYCTSRLNFFVFNLKV
jgi:hypothetical protein